MKTKRGVFATILAAILGLTIFAPTIASATNKGTESGDYSNADTCVVDWRASTVMSTALTNDDPEYPGLMVDLAGQPVDYSNGGYIQAVSPSFGDPGFLEITHFYYGLGAENATQVWRPVISTDHAIKNATATFTLPEEVIALVNSGRVTVTVDTASVNHRMKAWGGAYANYNWSPLPTDAVVNNGDGTYTINLGTMPRGTGTVLQFNVHYGTSGLIDPAQKYVADIKLTGTSTVGKQCKPELPALDIPEPDVCEIVYGGRSLWSVYEDGVYARDKYYWTEEGLTIGDNVGEVNNDSWGAGADAWYEGDTRVYRMYAATTVPLENVTWTVKATQGVTFSGINTQVSPGAGALQGNGYTVAVDGANVVLNEAGTEFTVTIDYMPAMSSISFNTTGVLTADALEKEILVVDHVLVGGVPDCEPIEPVVETSEWADVEERCEDEVVVQERTVTTTTYEWNRDSHEFVPVVITSVETREREMTEAEIAACQPVTPPTEEPSEDPTKDPDEDKTTPPVVVDKSPTPGSTLPNTGASIAGWIVAAFATLGAGALALGISRKRNA